MKIPQQRKKERTYEVRYIKPMRPKELSITATFYIPASSPEEARAIAEKEMLTKEYRFDGILTRSRD